MTNLMRNKKKRKKSVFYPIYFTLLAFVLVAIGIGLFALSNYLADYEATLPKYEAQKVANELFLPKPNYDRLIELSAVSVSPCETKEDCISAFEAQYTGEITYREVAAGLSGDKKYSVYAGDKKLGNFTLRETDKKSGHGFPIWEFSGVTVTELPKSEITVKIIRGTTLSVGQGTEKDAEAVTVGEKTPSCSHMPEGVDGILYDTYRFSGLIASHVPEALNAEGEKVELTYDEEGGVYVENPKNDAGLETEFKERIVSAAHAYATYMTRDGSLWNMSQYFDTSSKTYELIKNSDTWCYSEHLGYEFADENVGEFYSYGDGVFSARYTCTHNVLYTRSDTRVFPLDVTMYLKEIDGEYLIYDLTTNS